MESWKLHKGSHLNKRIMTRAVVPRTILLKIRSGCIEEGASLTTDCCGLFPPRPSVAIYGRGVVAGFLDVHGIPDR